MFAVIKTGSKQYRVKSGDVIKIEKLDLDKSSKVQFNEVLLIDDNGKVDVGNPVIESASVEGEIIDQIRDRKVVIFKKKRRHNYRRKKGHRQHLTVVKIISIKK